MLRESVLLEKPRSFTTQSEVFETIGDRSVSVASKEKAGEVRRDNFQIEDRFLVA